METVAEENAYEDADEHNEEGAVEFESIAADEDAQSYSDNNDDNDDFSSEYDSESEDEDSDMDTYNNNGNEDEVDDRNYEFNHRDNLPIHPEIDCSKADAMMMVEAYRIRHNLNWSAAADLNFLINSILGINSLPATPYLYKKKMSCKSSIISSRLFHIAKL